MSTHQDSDPRESLEFVGPDDSRWYRTQIPDWIALHPKVTHTAYRLLVIVRSLILEKQPDKVRLLSYEHLAFLLPGKSGKPTSVDVIKDALRVLHDVGLMSNPDGERIVRSTGRGGIQTRRRFRLHDWPAEGESYPGWRNAFDKLDAFTEDWRTARTDVPAGQIDGGKNPQRTDQGKHDLDADESSEEHPDSPAKTRVSAGRFVGGKNLSGGGKKPGDGGKKPGNAGVTSENADSLKEFPEGDSSSSNARDGDRPADGPAKEEEAAKKSEANDRFAVVAEQALDRAVAEWHRDHRHPDRAERARLVKRITTELAAGADVEDVMYHLTRDLAPSGVDTTAVQVVMSRTRESGWGKHPRPGSRSPQNRSDGPMGKCTAHHEPLPCPVCVRLHVPGRAPHALLTGMLREYGPDRRPDLAELLTV